MTDAEVFNALFGGGNYTLPYLIKFTRKGAEPLCFVNNNESVTYGGDLYNISSFDYTPPSGSGGASLSISGIDNSLVEFAEYADSSWSLEVTGVIAEGGRIERTGGWKHFHGSVSYTDDMKMEFSLENDGRLELQFCPYTFDTDNNRGNA